MLRLIVVLLFVSNAVFAKEISTQKNFTPVVKKFEMSNDRGLLYVVVTNKVHIPDYPIALDLRSDCKKQKTKKNWKQVENIDYFQYCDIDVGKIKINSSGTVLSIYAQKTDLEDLNSPNRSEKAGPKCMKAQWVHIELNEYCKKD